MVKNKKSSGIYAMATANFDAWLHSPRAWLMAICFILYCFLQAEAIPRESVVAGNSVELSMPELLFFKLNHGFFNMASLLFLVMISELPRRIAFQNSILLRASRIRWMASLILYIFWIVCIVLVLLIVFFTLFALPYAGTLYADSYTETALIKQELYEEYESLIPGYIRQGISPWEANVLAVLPIFFFWFCMALTILLISIWGYPLLGPLLFGILLFFYVTVSYEFFPNLIKTPVDFSNLSFIVKGREREEYQAIAEAMLGYAVVTGILITSLMCSVKRVPLIFHADSKE